MRLGPLPILILTSGIYLFWLILGRIIFCRYRQQQGQPQVRL
jgi:hypothetical protein